MKFRNQIANFQDVMKNVQINNGCYEWQKARTKAGYGNFWQGKKNIYVHRYVAEMFYAKPKKNAHVLHACDNPPCCNPDHLRWGTHFENMQDAKERGRFKGENVRRGENHYAAKLKVNEVYEIRKLKKEGWASKLLAKKFQVSEPTISRIINREIWKDA